jgi:hypothetical protein
VVDVRDDGEVAVPHRYLLGRVPSLGQADPSS